MKLIRHTALFLIISAFFISSCFLFDNDFHGNWTMIVWMDGDNNLEPAALDDLNEMEYGFAFAEDYDSKITKKLAIVVQVDRTPGYDTNSYDDGGDWTGTRRYLISPDRESPLSAGTTFNQIRSELLEDLGEVNMGDPAVLAEFIDFCKENYPSDHYALIFWNHGAGVRNRQAADPGLSRMFCIDETDDDDALFTGEISDVLTDDQDVDLIGIDACLMGMAEVAYEYRPGDNKFGADYFVASPAEEQWDGWEYSKILARLTGSGTDSEGDQNYDADELTPAQLAGIIVKEYEDFIEGYLPDFTSETLTALDLGLIEEVKTTLDSLAVQLQAEKTEAENVRGSGINPVTMEYFFEIEGSDYEGDADSINDTQWVLNPHFDLYDFAQRVSAGSSFSSGARAAAAQLMTAVDNCVLASYGGSDYNYKAYNSTSHTRGRHGLGFFFPDGDRYFSALSSYHYQLQWWYTNEDTNSWWPPSGNEVHLYGKIDFCNSDLDGTVETWRELLEYWFDIQEGGDWTYWTPGHY